MGVLTRQQGQKHQTSDSTQLLRNGLSNITLAPCLEDVPDLTGRAGLAHPHHLLAERLLQVSEDMCPLQGDVRTLLPGTPLCPDLYQQTRKLQSRLYGHHQHQALPRPRQSHGLRLRRRGNVGCPTEGGISLKTDLEQNEQ